MKKLIPVCIFFSVIANVLKAQQTYYLSDIDNLSAIHSVKNKAKPIRYNSLGYCFPIDNKDIIFGGASTSFKRLGFCLTYHMGIKNLMLPEGERSDFQYDNVVNNKWTITGNTQTATAVRVSACFVVAITKKWPVYVGPGIGYAREFFEFIDPTDNKPKWNINPNTSDFHPNYTAGTFIPIIGRFLLNVQYDYYPQSIYVGIVIRDRFTYEDIDEW